MAAYPRNSKGLLRRKRRPLRLTINLLLLLVWTGELAYLFVQQPGQDTPQNSLSVNSRVHAGPPRPTIERAANGVEIARLDLDRLSDWCRQAGLPDPPRLIECEPEVAQALMDALRKAAHGRAAGFGTVGKLSEHMECHDVALTYFTRAAELDAQDYRWTYYRGCVLQTLGRSNEAIGAFENTLRLNPAYECTYARLGQLLLDTSRVHDAVPRFQKYIELRPHDNFGYLGLGRAAFTRGDHPAALRHLTEAVQRNANDFQCQYYLARTYAALGDHAQAAAHFKLCEKLPKGAWFHIRDPLDQELHDVGGSVVSAVREFERLIGSGDLPKLAQLAERIVSQRPNDPQILMNLALIHAKLNRPAEARTVAAKVLALKPDDAMSYFVSCQVEFLAGDYPSAEAVCGEAIRRDSSQAGAHAIRGRALYLLGRLPEGIESMRQAVSQRPDDAGNAMFLADSLLETGQASEARGYYEHVLRLSPQNTKAAEKVSAIDAAMPPPHP